VGCIHKSCCIISLQYESQRKSLELFPSLERCSLVKPGRIRAVPRGSERKTPLKQ
jgi:hypothetical protein